MFDAHKGRSSLVFFLGVKGKALTRQGQHALVNKTINSRLHSLAPSVFSVVSRAGSPERTFILRDAVAYSHAKGGHAR